jgi:hypothetical protein
MELPDRRRCVQVGAGQRRLGELLCLSMSVFACWCDCEVVSEVMRCLGYEGVLSALDQASRDR